MLAHRDEQSSRSEPWRGEFPVSRRLRWRFAGRRGLMIPARILTIEAALPAQRALPAQKRPSLARRPEGSSRRGPRCGMSFLNRRNTAQRIAVPAPPRSSKARALPSLTISARLGSNAHRGLDAAPAGFANIADEDARAPPRAQV